MNVFIALNPEKYNLLVIDEPQSMPVNVVDRIVVASKQFRQILVTYCDPTTRNSKLV